MIANPPKSGTGLSTFIQFVAGFVRGKSRFLGTRRSSYTGKTFGAFEWIFALPIELNLVDDIVKVT